MFVSDEINYGRKSCIALHLHWVKGGELEEKGGGHKNLAGLLRMRNGGADAYADADAGGCGALALQLSSLYSALDPFFLKDAGVCVAWN